MGRCGGDRLPGDVAPRSSHPMGRCELLLTGLWSGGRVLVLAEEPRIDLIVRITGACGGDGAHAFALRRDEAGRWVEGDALGGAPHPVEVDLSEPDRISIVLRMDREYHLTAMRKQGSLFAGVEVSSLGERPYAVIALKGVERIPLPVENRDGTCLVIRSEGATVLGDFERRQNNEGSFFEGSELFWGSGRAKKVAKWYVERSLDCAMSVLAFEKGGAIKDATLWPAEDCWLGVERGAAGEAGHLICITSVPFSPLSG